MRKNTLKSSLTLTYLLLMTYIVLLTHLPRELIPSRLQESGLDKLAHIVAYGVIILLFIISLKTSSAVPLALVLFFAILAVGTIDELTSPIR